MAQDIYLNSKEPLRLPNPNNIKPKLDTDPPDAPKLGARVAKIPTYAPLKGVIAYPARHPLGGKVPKSHPVLSEN